ncbi:MAG: alpha/beta fold hydrolase [Burkholderiales bacterium]
MPQVRAGDIELAYDERGGGDNAVVFIHGNLGCKDWMDLVWPWLPGSLRVIAIEWRGCGDSDKPAPDPDYGNYSMEQHARDMLAAVRALGIERCHLCGHSTGGIIALHMLGLDPARFAKVLLLDPIGPMGLEFKPEQATVFARMKADRDFAAAVMATAMPTLFRPETLAPGEAPQFAATASEAQRGLFERLIERTRGLSDGIWLGTPHNLTQEWRAAALRARQEQIGHQILVLWGENDFWIPREHMEEMARRIPNCRLEIVPGVGHSMNVEQPEAFARRFTGFFETAGRLAPPAGSP